MMGRCLKGALRRGSLRQALRNKLRRQAFRSSSRRLDKRARCARRSRSDSRRQALTSGSLRSPARPLTQLLTSLAIEPAAAARSEARRPMPPTSSEARPVVFFSTSMARVHLARLAASASALATAFSCSALSLAAWTVRRRCLAEASSLERASLVLASSRSRSSASSFVALVFCSCSVTAERRVSYVCTMATLSAVRSERSVLREASCRGAVSSGAITARARLRHGTEESASSATSRPRPAGRVGTPLAAHTTPRRSAPHLCVARTRRARIVSTW
mmetsp:Transcript_19099/g.41142  ORF Transcript_19099/g.41142 Transcript_19099/m.41142 type:complete len:275 (-) Transcript_19099:1639-2463(-)